MRLGFGQRRLDIAARGQHHPVCDAKQRPRPGEAEKIQSLAGDQHALAKSAAKAEPVRLREHNAANAGEFGANAQAAARAQAKIIERVLPHGNARQAVFERQRRVHVLAAVHLHRADERIGGINGAQLHQAAGIHRPGHGAQAGGSGNPAQLADPGQFLRAGGALVERKGQIAAQQGARLRINAAPEGFAQRPGGGNRHHPQRQAGQENRKAAHAAAQFAPGKAPGQRPFGQPRTHEMRPSCMVMVRPARAARA